MKLSSPFYISSRLMAALKVGDGEINMEYSKKAGDERRTRYHYVIDVNGKEFDSHDLQSGNVRSPGLQSGFETLLSFLAAAGDSYRYNGNKMVEDSNTDLFPEWVCEWAYQQSDELSMMACELQENMEKARKGEAELLITE